MKETTFINELKRIFEGMDCLTDKKYVGRAFYGTIDKDLRLKATLNNLGHADNYSALKVEIIQRNEGVVDANLIRFHDIWGDKPTTNPNFSNGVSPHLWMDGAKLGWYVYTATDADMKVLSSEVEDFVSVYQMQNVSEEYSTGFAEDENDDEMEM